MSRKSLDRLASEAAASLAEYLQQGRTRTDLLKTTAATIVEMRSRFTRDDGGTDWGGRTREYRALIADVYDRAGVPADYLDTVQTALRYHVGNLLHEVVPADELAASGIRKAAPKVRLQTRRGLQAALAAAVEGGTHAAAPTLAVHAQALLERITLADLDCLAGDERVAARLALEAVHARAGTLLAHLGGGQTRGRRR